MFDRMIGDTGWRLDTTQDVSLRLLRAGAWLTPAIGFRQTNYRVDATPDTPERTYSRSLPITSIDSGLRFERMSGPSRNRVQTIEPRLLLVHIPYEEQSELPVFDTIVPDFNLIQLFNKYQFTGPDRIADTDRVSFGLTTRLLDAANGRELLSATIGQTRYRDPRRIMLPDEDPIESTRSNYVGELGISLSERWDLELGHQRNGDTGDTVRARTRLVFSPTAEHLFGIGYRKRAGLLEQGDFSMVWPIRDRWRLIGQYSYSFLDEKALERFAGIEYEACCWRLQLTTRRYIVRSTGQTENTISIKFELKGLANSRESPDELLQRGILGGGNVYR
jgi:LPS-assembly protein